MLGVLMSDPWKPTSFQPRSSARMYTMCDFDSAATARYELKTLAIAMIDAARVLPSATFILVLLPRGVREHSRCRSLDQCREQRAPVFRARHACMIRAFRTRGRPLMSSRARRN